MGDDGINFNFFIQSTIQKNIPWKSLAFLLLNLATTHEKSKQVIEILVKELEFWVSKVETNQIKNEDIPMEDQNDVQTNNSVVMGRTMFEVRCSIVRSQK